MNIFELYLDGVVKQQPHDWEASSWDVSWDMAAYYTGRLAFLSDWLVTGESCGSFYHQTIKNRWDVIRQKLGRFDEKKPLKDGDFFRKSHWIWQSTHGLHHRWKNMWDWILPGSRPEIWIGCLSKYGPLTSANVNSRYRMDGWSSSSIGSVCSEIRKSQMAHKIASPMRSNDVIKTY